MNCLTKLYCGILRAGVRHHNCYLNGNALNESYYQLDKSEIQSLKCLSVA